MILRRSSRTDPRRLRGSTMLGSALALALPLGVELTAFAQAPSPSTAQSPAATPALKVPQSVPAASAAPANGADALKAHDQEFNAALARQRASSQNQAGLRVQID